MIKRLLLLLSPLVLVLSMIPLTAHADAPVHYTPCDGSPGMTATQVADTVRNQYPSGWIASLDWNNPDISALFGIERLDSGDYKYVIFWNGTGSSTVSPGTKITFASDGSTDNFSFTGDTSGGQSLVTNMDGTYYSTANSSDQVASSGYLTCISEVKNVLFDTSYTGTHFGASPNSSYMPQYSLSVTKQDLSLSLLTPTGSDLPDYKYAIGLYRCADLSQSYDTCDVTGDHIIYEGIQDKAPTTWNYHVSSEGHYQLYILIVKPDTTSFDEANNILVDSGFYALKVDVDGGAYTMSSGDLSGCTTSTSTGRTQLICSGATLQACDLPTLDVSDVPGFVSNLGGYIGCQMTNFQRLMTSAFYILFIPSPYALQQIGGQFDTWGRAHLAPFYQFSDWLTGTFTPALHTSEDIVCNYSFGNFFGHNFTLNACVVDQQYPAIWGVITSVIRFTVVLLLLLLVYNRVLDVLQVGIARGNR